jgi:type I restriction enzyme R subunit
VNEILTEQIPTAMRSDERMMDSIVGSPDKQNAKVKSDEKLETIMQQYLFSQTEIFKKFKTDPDFHRRYKEFIFDTLWQQGKHAGLNP